MQAATESFRYTLGVIAGIDPALITWKLMVGALTYLVICFGWIVEALIWIIFAFNTSLAFAWSTYKSIITMPCGGGDYPPTEVQLADEVKCEHNVWSAHVVLIQTIVIGLGCMMFWTAIIIRVWTYLYVVPIGVPAVRHDSEASTNTTTTSTDEIIVLEAFVGVNNTYRPSPETMNDAFKGELLVFMGNAQAGWVTRIAENYLMGLSHVIEVAIASGQQITLVSPSDLTKGFLWDASSSKKVFEVFGPDGRDMDISVWEVKTNIFSVLKTKVAKLATSRVDNIVKTNSQIIENGTLSLLKSIGTTSESNHMMTIFHNAHTVPGSSGSALKNAIGEVVGVHAGCFVKTNINFAYRVDLIKRWLDGNWDINLESDLGHRGEKRYNVVSVERFNEVRKEAEDISATLQFFSGGKKRAFNVAPAKDSAQKAVIAEKSIFPFVYTQGKLKDWIDKAKNSFDHKEFAVLKIEYSTSSDDIIKRLSSFADHYLTGEEKIDFISDLIKFEEETKQNLKTKYSGWGDVEVEVNRRVAEQVSGLKTTLALLQQELNLVKLEKSDFQVVKENTQTPALNKQQSKDSNSKVAVPAAQASTSVSSRLPLKLSRRQRKRLSKESMVRSTQITVLKRDVNLLKQECSPTEKCSEPISTVPSLSSNTLPNTQIIPPQQSRQSLNPSSEVLTNSMKLDTPQMSDSLNSGELHSGFRQEEKSKVSMMMLPA